MHTVYRTAKNLSSQQHKIIIVHAGNVMRGMSADDDGVLPMTHAISAPALIFKYTLVQKHLHSVGGVLREMLSIKINIPTTSTLSPSGVQSRRPSMIHAISAPALIIKYTPVKKHLQCGRCSKRGAVYKISIPTTSTLSPSGVQSRRPSMTHAISAPALIIKYTPVKKHLHSVKQSNRCWTI